MSKNLAVAFALTPVNGQKNKQTKTLQLQFKIVDFFWVHVVTPRDFFVRPVHQKCSHMLYGLAVLLHWNIFWRRCGVISSMATDCETVIHPTKFITDWKMYFFCVILKH